LPVVVVVVVYFCVSIVCSFSVSAAENKTGQQLAG